MATFAVRRLSEMVSNTAVVVGVEAVAVAQGIDLERTPDSPRRSAAVEGVLAEIRRKLAFLELDRYLAGNVEIMHKSAMQQSGSSYSHTLFQVCGALIEAFPPAACDSQGTTSPPCMRDFGAAGPLGIVDKAQAVGEIWRGIARYVVLRSRRDSVMATNLLSTLRLFINQIVCAQKQLSELKLKQN